MPARRSTRARPLAVVVAALSCVLTLLASGLSAGAGAEPGLLVLGL